ncbi:pteridine reductase [Alteromonas sp. CYL-A6]|uniref:pteridine reductase n=1 Tax=Alteromonas nitratireducens TaxID=3390813 RepID=UPI0034B787F3
MSESSPVALVTGAAKRIGATIVRHLHANGYRVIIHCNQSVDDAQQLADALNTIRPHSASVIQGNLCDDNAVADVANQAMSVCGRLDVLVNNASAFYPTPVGDISLSDWDALVGSNAKGPLFLSQALVPALRERGGNIVNIVDMHIDRPLPSHSVYCMAKSALATMTQALAVDLAPDIRVNGIGPGAILWPERTLSDDEQQAMLNTIPLRRLGTPDDIASTLGFLINAPYITGQIIYVDGGRSVNANTVA